MTITFDDAAMLFPTEETKKVIFCKSPSCIYERIPNEIRRLVLRNKPIPLNKAKGMPVELTWFVDLGSNKATQTIRQWAENNKLPIKNGNKKCLCGTELSECTKGDFITWRCANCFNSYYYESESLYPLGKFSMTESCPKEINQL